MHFNSQDTVALTCFASAPFDIERESSCGIALGFGIIGFGKQFPNVGKYTGIGCWIGTRCPSNRRLVNVNDLVQKLRSLHAVKISVAGSCTVQLCRQIFIQNLVDQRGLSRAGNTSYTGKYTKRNGNINVFQVMLSCTMNG